MDPDELKEKIAALKRERHAVILAHNYQIGDVQDVADFVGDSLELSRKAAETRAEVIVFCGVHFMAETAAILSPEKTVLLPDLFAGCPMADMITAGELRRMKDRHPGSEVVCYVNTSASVKSESDICCTSANIVDVILSLDPKNPPICVPDRNLALYARQKAGREIILWEGYCYVHSQIMPAHVIRQKELHPEAKVLAHPECSPDVLALADEVLSTSGMCRFAVRTDAREMIIGTEAGILHKLRKENPGKIFYPVSDQAICENMKKTTLFKVWKALEKMQFVVKVPEEIRSKAWNAVHRMIQLQQTPQARA